MNNNNNGIASKDQALFARQQIHKALELLPPEERTTLQGLVLPVSQMLLDNPMPSPPSPAHVHYDQQFGWLTQIEWECGPDWWWPSWLVDQMLAAQNGQEVTTSKPLACPAIVISESTGIAQKQPRKRRPSSARARMKNKIHELLEAGVMRLDATGTDIVGKRDALFWDVLNSPGMEDIRADNRVKEDGGWTKFETFKDALQDVRDELQRAQSSC